VNIDRSRILYRRKRLGIAWAAKKYIDICWLSMMSWMDNGYIPRSLASYRCVGCKAWQSDVMQGLEK
jgi:hypothetical protein